MSHCICDGLHPGVYRVGTKFMALEIARYSVMLAKWLVENREITDSCIEETVEQFNILREVPNDIDTIWTELNRAIAK